MAYLIDEMNAMTDYISCADIAQLKEQIMGLATDVCEAIDRHEFARHDKSKTMQDLTKAATDIDNGCHLLALAATLIPELGWETSNF